VAATENTRDNLIRSAPILRLFTASHPAIWDSYVANPCDWLEAAVVESLQQIAAVEPGRLVSLSLELPPQFFDAAKNGRGDRLWHAPNEGAHFIGGGAVTGCSEIDAARWQAECRRWVRLGDRGPTPLGFLSAPPAPSNGAARICLPQVLLRRHGDRLSVILSAFRDSTPVAAVARLWAGRFRSMIVHPGASGGGAIERQFSYPDRIEWRKRVHAAVGAIAEERLSKVVLARKLVVSLQREIDADGLALQLAETCPDCRIIKLPHRNGQVLAASPELLAVKRGAEIVSHALAGTAARFGEAGAEARAAAQLLASSKERREHALVVESIASGLRDLCDDVRHPAIPALMRLRRLQHLWTPVSGRLRQDYGLLDAIARLHPTPAVLGFPKIAARDWLRKAEERRGGLYTGVAGWIDIDGDGEAAIVLRSAYIEGREAQLWAGAGIMAESDPDEEWKETELKMSSLLDLLEGSGR
jgi:menaquinone-specific isochorismate synthase